MRDNLLFCPATLSPLRPFRPGEGDVVQLVVLAPLNCKPSRALDDVWVNDPWLRACVCGSLERHFDRQAESARLFGEA